MLVGCSLSLPTLIPESGNAGTWFDTTSLATNIRNFPADRGTVIGILKSFLGLSASIYSSIYITTFAPDAVAFLRFLAIVPPLVVLCAGFFINFVPNEMAISDDKESMRAASASSGFAEGVRQPLLAPNSQHSPEDRSHSHQAPESPSPAYLKQEASAQPHAAGGAAAVAIKIHAGRALLPPALTLSGQSSRSVAVSRETRFLFIYLIVALFAIYQMASSLYEAQHSINSLAQEVILSGMVVLLALLLLVPVASGECLHPSRRSLRSRNTISTAREVERSAQAPAANSSIVIATMSREEAFASSTRAKPPAQHLLSPSSGNESGTSDSSTVSARNLKSPDAGMFFSAGSTASGLAGNSGSSSVSHGGGGPSPHPAELVSPRDTWSDVGPPVFHTPEGGSLGTARSSFCSALSETGIAGSVGNMSVGWRADSGVRGHGSDEGEEDEDYARPPASLTTMQVRVCLVCKLKTVCCACSSSVQANYEPAPDKHVWSRLS